MAKKRSYSDINGNLRAFDQDINNDGSNMETDTTQNLSQSSSLHSPTAHIRARVSDQSSVQAGNNTDQSQTDDAL